MNIKFERRVFVCDELLEVWRTIEALKTDLAEVDAHPEVQERLNKLQIELTCIRAELIEDIPDDFLD